MSVSIKLSIALLLASCAVLPARAAESCSAIAAQATDLRKAKDVPRLLALVSQARAPGSGCDDTKALMCLGRQAALAHVEVFYGQVDAKAPYPAMEKTLTDGLRQGEPWPLLLALADIRFEEGRRVKKADLLVLAARNYQETLNALRDEEPKPGEAPLCANEPAPARAQIAAIHRSMSTAVLLAPRLEKVPTRDNRCGGTFLAGIRGFVPESRPVPIQFKYNEAALTPEGEVAARTLAECVKSEQYKLIELSGHTDQRGTDAYNLDLSARRLATVRGFLQKEGYSGQVVATPKGKSEPFRADDRGKYSQEELDQFDRRVELRRSETK